MWRTTSILEIKAWTASTSPDSKLRSLTIANSIGARAGHNPQRFVLGNSTIRKSAAGAN
jgi:hypothetical protein